MRQFASLKTDEVVWQADTSASYKVFVRMAVKKLKAEAGAADAAPRNGEGAAENALGAEQIHMNAMCKFFGKAKPLVKVNLAERMSELALDRFFDSDSWPEAAAVRELKTKVKNISGDGFENPFVFAELRK
jgi:hypothetical protein